MGEDESSNYDMGFYILRSISGTAAMTIFVFPFLNGQSLLKRSTALGNEAGGTISM